MNDIPWELAFVQSRDTDAGGGLAGPSLLRHLELESDLPPLKTRPVGLVALAQLSNQRDAILHPRNFIPGIGNVLRRSPPLYIAKEIGGELEHFMSYQYFLDAVRRIQPDVLVLAAHGTARPQPSIFFENEADSGLPNRIPLHDLMNNLEGFKKPRLAVFLCCDLAGVFGQSGGTALVTGGAGEAVVMQGIVRQSVAERFVKAMLLHLQTREGFAEAVRSGREMIHHQDRAQAILPVAFSAWDGGASIARWEVMRSAYRIGLQDFNRSSLPGLPWDQGEARREILSNLCETPGIHVVLAPYSPTERFIYGPFVDLKIRQGSEVGPGVRRPLIVVSGESRIGAREHDSACWKSVLHEVSGKLEEVGKAQIAPPGLGGSLAQPRTPKEAARSLAKAVEDYGVSLVVAPVELEGEDKDQDDEFWSELLAYMKAEPTNGVVILVPALDLLRNVNNTLGDHLSDSHEISPLSPSEIDAILAQPSGEPQAHYIGYSGEELHTLTGGNPFLVDLIRRAITEGHPIKDLDDLLKADREHVAMAASRVLLNLVTGDPHFGFYALAQVKGPASRLVIAEAFFEGLVQPVWAAERLGILAQVFEEHASEDSKRLFLPPDLATALGTLLEEENPEIALRAAEISYDALSEPDAVERIAPLPGGVQVLAAAQRLWIEAWRKTNDEDYFRLAGNMTYMLVDLDNTQPLRPRRVVVDMLKLAVDLGKPRGICVDFLNFSAANLLYRHGASEEALQHLDHLPDDLPSISLPVALAARTLRANILKDLEQQAGVAEMLSLLDEVILWANEEIAKTEADVKAPTQLEDAIKDAQYTRMKCELFLQGTDVDETLPLFSDLLADKEQRTITLAAMVERGLKGNPPDWTRVEDWAARAERSLATPAGSRHPNAAYCYYHLAQFYRRRTAPDLRASKAFYEACITAARGLKPELEALGLTRLVDVMTQLGHPEQDVVQVLRNLESAVEAVQRGDATRAAKNAFSARVLVRAQRQLAKHDRNAANALLFCHEAANAASAPILEARKTERDKHLLAQTLETFLERVEELEGDYMATWSFLRQFEEIAKDWLGVTVNPGNRVETKVMISDWLVSHPARC